MSDSLIALSMVFNRRKTFDSKGLAVIEVYLNKDGLKSILIQE